MYTEIAEVGKFIWENKNTFKKNLSDLISLIINGRVRLGIVGAGGTGKSTLGKTLNGTHFEMPPKYRESLAVEKYKLEDVGFSTLLVFPGQSERADFRWQPFFEQLVRGKVRGVINVVSWGYHSFPEIGYKEHKCYQEGMSIEDFMEVYLHERRQVEISLLKQVVAHLKNSQGKIWMLTFVSKQDLWWDRRQEVKEYYVNGEYNELVAEIAKQKGEQNFTHEFLSASLVMQNFQTTDRVILSPTCAGYDQGLQVTNLDQLLKGILALCS